MLPAICGGPGAPDPQQAYQGERRTPFPRGLAHQGTRGIPPGEIRRRQPCGRDAPDARGNGGDGRRRRARRGVQPRNDRQPAEPVVRPPSDGSEQGTDRIRHGFCQVHFRRAGCRSHREAREDELFHHPALQRDGQELHGPLFREDAYQDGTHPRPEHLLSPYFRGYLQQVRASLGA